MEVVLSIDVSGCKDVPPEQRLECIQSMTEALSELINVAEILVCIGNLDPESGLPSTDSTVACGRGITLEERDTGTYGFVVSAGSN